jgi:hypothetical protein
LILQTYHQCAAHNFSVLAPLNTRIPANGLTFNAPRKRTHCNRALAASASAKQRRHPEPPLPFGHSLGESQLPEC